MDVFDLSGVRIDGIYACLPQDCEDNLARCTEIYGDREKAEGVVKTTGIRTRRVAAPGVSSLDLCVGAASRLLADLGIGACEIGAVVCVTFTPKNAMPCNASQAQSRLALPPGIAAFDLGLACSGWAYGLYVAGLLAKSMGRKVLFLDGDVQTRHLDPDDGATVPVLADAGTATIVSPCDGSAAPWKFAFMTRGDLGEALQLPPGGCLKMDGFGVFKFVTTEALGFVRDFMAAAGATADSFDAFVPHQANVFMIRQMARKLNFAPEALWVSGDVLGNSGSASIPVTIAHCGASVDRQDGLRLLVAGFGGGLSAAAAAIRIDGSCRLESFDFSP